MSEQGLPAVDICSCFVPFEAVLFIGSVGVLAATNTSNPLPIHPYMHPSTYPQFHYLCTIHLSIHASIYLPITHTSIHLLTIHIHIDTCLPTTHPTLCQPPIYVPIYPSTNLPINASIYPALMHLPTADTSIYLSTTTYIYTHPPTHPSEVFRIEPPTFLCEFCGYSLCYIRLPDLCQ